MEDLSNDQLVRKIIKDIKSDMSDSEIIEKIVNKNVAKNVEKKKETLAERCADWLAKVTGSWWFIGIFFGIIVVWMIINIMFLVHPFDPYPFILLNLFLSCISAIQTPIIIMSQNRQEKKDRQRSENAYLVNIKTEIIIRDMYHKMNTMFNRMIRSQEKMYKYLNDNFNKTEAQPIKVEIVNDSVLSDNNHLNDNK